ncbi:hypothetical protein N7490_009904 [Penicillium lividum]|nr:hypothetical protein N7490_009904 [Penicillium lividum]
MTSYLQKEIFPSGKAVLADQVTRCDFITKLGAPLLKVICDLRRFPALWVFAFCTHPSGKSAYLLELFLELLLVAVLCPPLAGPASDDGW